MEMAKGKRTYCVENFTASTPEQFSSKFEKLLNDKGESGWRLHSFNAPGILGNACIVVFYKDGSSM